MSIASEISRLQTAKADLKTAIEGKGVTVPSATTIDGYPALVDSIPSGGGHPDDFERYLTGDSTFTDYSSDIEVLAYGAFEDSLYPNYVNLPKLKDAKGRAFMNSKIISAKMPLVESIATALFQTDSVLTALVLPSLDTSIGYTYSSANVLLGCSALTAIDFGPKAANTFASNFANGCTALSTIILRRSESIVQMVASNSLTNTPFYSGGNGGTVYIPKVLYDHLGDGTAYDYQSATNWSTYHGYGTITWAKIEGSIYETQYADGTPIAS